MAYIKKISTAAVIALLLNSALAAVLTVDETKYPFKEPDGTMSRGPCPGLNALANHGILPRDGKNLDLATVKAAAKYLAMGDTSVEFIMPEALKTSTTGVATTFNLHDIVQHEPQVLEYDGSMSRTDTYFGDAAVFNGTVWDRTQASWTAGSDTITLKESVAELKARTTWCKSKNPKYQATLGNTAARFNYGNLYFAFGDPVAATANKTLVKYLFENERLPTELGWKVPETESSVTAIEALTAKMV